MNGAYQQCSVHFSDRHTLNLKVFLIHELKAKLKYKAGSSLMKTFTKGSEEQRGLLSE